MLENVEVLQMTARVLQTLNLESHGDDTGVRNFFECLHDPWPRDRCFC